MAEKVKVSTHLHHVHIFASDLARSVSFYERNFDGRVVFDAELAGVRNVFMRIGAGRLHFYDQPPKHAVRGNIHHFGIQTDDIEKVVGRLKHNGVVLDNEISDFGVWKYIMVPAPDDIVIELLEVDKARIPAQYRSYFE